MSAEPSLLSDFLSNPIMDTGMSNLSEPDGARKPTVLYSQSRKPGEIDYRIRQLSYSSILSLHECPRKFQLYKLRAQRAEDSLISKITFAFGHVVGHGIQRILSNIPLRTVLWEMFLMWDVDLFAADEKKDKSFWFAVIAIEKFAHLRATTDFLEEYDVVEYNGKPACELSFCINFPDGFRLRGYVDVVLKHRVSGAIMVLELKTTGASTFSPSQYKNSSQAIGYSVVLDSIAPDVSSYEVLYLVYQTQKQQYTPIPFTKSYLQRALWIKELLLEIEKIKMYEEHDVYPMHGESCYSYFRDCEYINSCQLSTDLLVVGFDAEKHTDAAEYQINLSITDLIEAQVKKISAGSVESVPLVPEMQPGDVLL
jgi:hypothetical protein